jgi:hypothetical protein
MVALYSFENFFCTYWFISEVLPTLQEKGRETQVSTRPSTAVHMWHRHSNTGHQWGKGRGGARLCSVNSALSVLMLLLY